MFSIRLFRDQLVLHHWPITHYISSLNKRPRFELYSFSLCKVNFTCCTRRRTFEPPRDKTNKMACAPSKDSDQPGHPPSLIRVFAVRMKKAWVLSYALSAQRLLSTDWADAQADLSLSWTHSHFVGFVMRRLISL